MSGLRFFTGALSSQPSATREQIIGLLKDFCIEVESVTNQRVTCLLDPGFTTGLGQELRVTARSISKQIDHILFRAYVPMDGLPLNLDFYGDEMKACDTVADAAQALAEFARLPVTLDTLQLLSQ